MFFFPLEENSIPYPVRACYGLLHQGCGMPVILPQLHGALGDVKNRQRSGVVGESMCSLGSMDDVAAGHPCSWFPNLDKNGILALVCPWCVWNAWTEPLVCHRCVWNTWTELVFSSFSSRKMAKHHVSFPLTHTGFLFSLPSLNENALSLLYVSAQYQVSGLFWEGLGGVAFLKEVVTASGF